MVGGRADAEYTRGGIGVRLVIEVEDGVITDVFSDVERPSLKILVQDWDTEGLE